MLFPCIHIFNVHSVYYLFYPCQALSLLFSRQLEPWVLGSTYSVILCIAQYVLSTLINSWFTKKSIGKRNRVPFESTERFRYWMQLSNCMVRGNPFVKAHRKLLVLFQRIDVQQQFHNVIMLITTWVYISGIAHSTPCTLPISQSFALKHGTVQISLVVFLHFGPLLCKRPIAMPRLHGRASERCSCGVW